MSKNVSGDKESYVFSRFLLLGIALLLVAFLIKIIFY